MNSTSDLIRNDTKKYKNKQIRRYKSENSLETKLLLLLPEKCKKLRYQGKFDGSRIHYSGNHFKSIFFFNYIIINFVVISIYNTIIIYYY
jgi:hypothetical protein